MFDKSNLLMLMGAIVLFTLLLMNINNFLLDSNTLEVRTKMSSTAAALSQGIIDEAKTKAFDETTVSGQRPANIPGDFSSTLGLDSGETYNTCDDFDDYNGYSTTDTTDIGVFHINVAVEYVTDADLSKKSSTQTTHKRMIVSVSNSVMQDTVALTYVKNYY